MIVGGGSSWVWALMWTPGAASIVARLILREGFADVSFRVGGRQGLKSHRHCGAIPDSHWTDRLWYRVDLRAGRLHAAAGRVVARFVGDSTPPILVFVINLALAATIVAVFSARVAAGEEIGWRGYMLTRLIDAGVP